MTASVKQHAFRTPSGKVLRASREPSAADVDRFAAEADAWYARNRHVLGAFSTEQFLEEKHQDVEKGLL